MKITMPNEERIGNVRRYLACYQTSYDQQQQDATTLIWSNFKAEDVWRFELLDSRGCVLFSDSVTVKSGSTAPSVEAFLKRAKTNVFATAKALAA